jgi:hypothetical protein
MSDMSHDERDADGPGGRLDVEAAFADIVLHWDDAHQGPVGTWPAQEDVDAPASGQADATAAEVGQDGAVETQDGSEADPSFTAYDGPHVPLAPAGWSPREDPAPQEPEGYVPPEPPPLPRGDLVGWLAWIAVLSGPIFLGLASIVWTDIARLWIMLAVLAFIAGFATLVARMPNSRSDDGPDDGAVV